MRKWIAVLLILMLSLTACAPEEEQSYPGPTAQEPMTEPIPPEPVSVSGTARLVITGMEWGPVISKVVLELDCVIDSESVNMNTFSAQVPTEKYRGILEEDAQTTPLSFSWTVSIRAAYTCDENGNISDDSNRIALELSYDPTTPAPTVSDGSGRGMTFCDFYDLFVMVNETAELRTAEGAPVTDLVMLPRLDMKDAWFPQLEKVSLDGVFTGSDGITLTYADYQPGGEGKLPLVIWLHGGGEGGTDVRSVIYGNEVTALFSEEFQHTMGGAYVLMPQCPTMWMQREENGNGSVYRETLMELIESYVNQNPKIDSNRIYVGGCSNGGFMTVDLLLNYPDYFAAAYPICGAYDSANITDDQVKSISHVPMWFVHAQNDPVVNQDRFLNVAFRLRTAGAEIHISLFEDVHDTSGRYNDLRGGPYQYIGHWSWIWFFNNACEDGGLNMWQWLSQQSK